MCLFSFYLNIVVLNVWEIHAPLHKALQMLGGDCTLTGVLYCGRTRAAGTALSGSA